MATGKVNTALVNTMSGNFTVVERLWLYVGLSGNTENLGEILPISAQSDLDALLGSGDSELKTQISAARTNSRSDNFVCYAIELAAEDDWKDAVYAALEKPADLNVEAIVLCSPVENKTEVEACQTVATECMTRFAKLVHVHAAVRGIDDETESWSEYLTFLGTLVDNVAAVNVSLVPLLHGNNLGVVAGRLCDPAVTIADSPMRTATGALIGLGEAPEDKNAAPLDSATIEAMSTARFSVPQWHTGYDGMYWADHMTLDAEGGDFQVYENPRVLHYCARRVRILAIGRIADRRLNSTARSIAANKTYFARPLREASKSIIVAGTEMPGIIKPPGDDAIGIVWNSFNDVSIAVSAQPYNCAKTLTLYLALKLSTS